MSDKPLYKVLVDGKSCHGGTLKWSLPKNETPGDWHSFDGPLRMCERGIHLTESPFSWYKRGCEVYEAEYRGEILHDSGNKACVREARLIREVPFPAPWLRVEKFLNGIAAVQWFKPDGSPDPEWKLYSGSTWDAARDAAWAAARAAAWAAAGAAAGAAARAAARDAAWAAAGAAARAAARDAAWDAERI